LFSPSNFMGGGDGLTETCSLLLGGLVLSFP
jgi:hypothetical protein